MDIKLHYSFYSFNSTGTILVLFDTIPECATECISYGILKLDKTIAFAKHSSGISVSCQAVDVKCELRCSAEVTKGLKMASDHRHPAFLLQRLIL